MWKAGQGNPNVHSLSVKRVDAIFSYLDIELVCPCESLLLGHVNKLSVAVNLKHRN